MSLNVIQLQDLLKSENASEEEIKKILLTFVSVRFNNSNEPHDVETFLHCKAISFENMDLARTYLVFSEYQQKNILVGYFSISNKPLVIAKRNFQKLPNSLKKKLMGIGHKTEMDNYEIKGYLLGQLGKNYSEEALKTKALDGNDLLQLATDAMHVAYKASGGRIFYLECDDDEKLKRFYHDAGFRELEDFKSVNGYCIFVRKIEC